MKRGFSTLEILIALTILATAFVGVVLLTSGQNLGLDAQLSAEALGSARKALETQQSLARKDFKLVVATTTTGAILGVQSTTTVTVTQRDLYTKLVTATVTWQSTYGRTPSVSLSTLVANFGNAVGGDTCSSVLADANGDHDNWLSPQTTTASLATLVGDSNVNAAYPITDIDVYERNAYVSVSTSVTSLGANNPGAGTNVNTAGTLAWSNPGNITSNNSSDATRTLSGTNVTHYLRASNFGFAVPPGATITGVRVEVEKSASGNSSSNAVIDSAVRLVRADGSVGTQNKALTNVSTDRWPTSDTYVSYGSATDTWGEQLKPSDVNDPDFGVAIAATGISSGTNRTAQVDHVRITVSYTKRLYVLDLTNPAAPVYRGGLATSTVSQGITALATATSTKGHYVYAATAAANLNQLQIIDVKDRTSPYQVSTFPTVAGTGMGTGAGNSIFYKDGYAYVGLLANAGTPEFNIIDVSTPAVPVWKGGYTVGAHVNAIVVKDGYAYVTTNDTARELLVLNITNPASPTLVTSFNAAPDQTNFGYGRALYTVGDNVYLGRSWTNSGSIGQFVSIDGATVPLVQRSTKTLGTNQSLNGIVVRNSLAFLLTGSQVSGGSVQIVNATSTAQYGSSISLGTSGPGGVALDCEGNYLYAASVDSSSRGSIMTITGN